MSLRARLTLSYAIFAATLLTLVAGAMVFFVLYLSTRPIADALDLTTKRAQAIAYGRPGTPASRVLQDERALPVPNGVIVRVNEHRRERGPGGPPPEGPGHTFGPLDVGWVFGLHPHVVTVGKEATVFIAPDLRQLRAMTQTAAASFAIAFAVTLIASWLIGRWITTQAVRPLSALAAELRRFASGDFTPRAVNASEHGDVGELVEAYNGAAAQVAAAFQERARVEEHMRRFLGEAGHEMRTPLTVISGYLDVLERGGIDNAEVRALALPTMRTETRRLRALVERLMTLARLEGDDRRETEVVDVVSSARDAIHEVKAARGGTVRLRAEGDHVVVAEPAEVYEAIVNLVDNAVKYGAGNPVDVAIESDANGGTVVRVSDRGPGIAEADRGRLFERFFRGEASNGIEGSGLGLAIVARAAERSHGTVGLESSGPGGTTFRLTFPPYRAPERARSAIVLG
ncbi:MAG TPA: HAMP domain-containing sensor histidine kinase [Candidatus Elarobacter sp.]|jgi:two-component system OmpR family sensor kinase|nr:HAMP domain-containing sensor histidine kinase [Candidatus Elarobacter sp.]